MINKLKVENIQSHKETELTFSDGVNVIVGSSNNGKSAILRALYWAIYNRPLGIDTLCSHWALDDKGRQKSPMRVTVTKGAKTLVREKSKDQNMYIVDGSALEAIRTDVPDDVRRFFMLNETNIQKQQDAPFLVSATNGEVAKYFNNIAKLDVIDRVLSYTEQTKRKVKATIDNMEKESAEYELLISGFNWVDEIAPILDEYDELDSQVNSIVYDIENLNDSYYKYCRFKTAIDKLSGFMSAKDMLAEYDSIDSQIKSVEATIADINSQILDYKAYADKISMFSNVGDASGDIRTYENICMKIDSISSDCTILDNSIRAYKRYVGVINDSMEEVRRLREQLPDICPLCGGVMHKEVSA